MRNGEKHNKMKNPLVTDAILIFDKIYCITSEICGLVVFDINTSKTSVIEYPIRDHRKYMFKSMELIGDTIYLIPAYCNQIITYNTFSNEMGSIDIPSEFILDSKSNYMASAVWEKYLFLFGVCVPYVLKIDTEKKAVVNHIELENINENDAYFRKQSVIIDNIIYIPFCNQQTLLKMQLDTMQYELKHFGNEKLGYSGICQKDGKFFLAPRKDNDLLIWDESTGDIFFKKNSLVGSGLSYIGIEVVNGEVTLIPMSWKNNIVKDIKVYKGEYEFFRKQDNIFLMYDKLSKMVLILGERNESYSIRLTRDQCKNIIAEDIDKQHENDMYDVLDFLEKIIEGNSL